MPWPRHRPSRAAPAGAWPAGADRLRSCRSPSRGRAGADHAIAGSAGSRPRPGRLRTWSSDRRSPLQCPAPLRPVTAHALAVLAAARHWSDRPPLYGAATGSACATAGAATARLREMTPPPDYQTEGRRIPRPPPRPVNTGLPDVRPILPTFLPPFGKRMGSVGTCSGGFRDAGQPLLSRLLPAAQRRPCSDIARCRGPVSAAGATWGPHHGGSARVRTGRRPRSRAPARRDPASGRTRRGDSPRSARCRSAGAPAGDRRR
jgi:hypothetical protein